jgi:TonB family protein
MIVDGRYRVLETILDSDNRAVYLTEHQLIRRRMVVKVMHADAAATPDAVARFVSAAEAAGRLRHPNIVESTDMGFVDGRPFVVFEHLQGSRLSEEIARLGRLPVRRAVHVARQVAAALGAAHLEGIVHGGLDSEHVFLIDRETDPDFVKVLGLGKLGDGRGHTGSPEVLAPEQIVGADVDHRCDVWALGVLLHEMIGGRRPFSADAGAATARRRIVSADPPALDRPDVPDELVEVILACLAKHPDERFQDMAQLDDALAPFDVRFARGSRTTIPPLPSITRIKRPSSPQSAVVPRSPSMALRVPTPSPSSTPTLVTVRPPSRSRVALAATFAALAVGGAGLWFALDRGTDRAPASSRSVGASAPETGSLGAAGATVDRAAPIEIAVSADRADARVTFRRRVTPAPMAIDASPADMVELVEVSAPGFKTVRYWITFDRPTHLHARLVQGSGLIEATELETLIALGETEQPVVAPVAAKTAAPERQRRAQRRSIGRDAASPAPTADDPAPTPAAVEVEVDPGPREVVDVAAMQVAKPAVVAPTAPAAPRQVAAGFLESNRIAGNARIMPDNATRQAMRHVGERRITGSFKLCVTATGAVSKVAMTRSSGHKEYDEVIMKELRAWRFKPIAIAGQPAAVCASIAIAYSQQ